MKRALSLAAILVLAGTPALAHRLDEYLQGTILSVEKDRVRAQMTLTPGVAVYSAVLTAIDTNNDGVISPAEQRAYAERVLSDLSLAIDGRRLTPRLVSTEFPAIEEMREGRGEITLEFVTDLPGDSGNRKLTLDNHHQSKISVYQVNCLVSRDPDIRIVAQNRNYTQSHYELDYVQTGAGSVEEGRAWWASNVAWLTVAGALFVAGLFVFPWPRNSRGAAV